jgi:hypothetical protein
MFLFGIYSFYSVQSKHAIALIIFWGVFMAIWPLKLPQLLSAMRFSFIDKPQSIGKLMRIDSPGILRFAITETIDWDSGKPLIYQRVDHSQQWVLPLYSHLNEQKRIGTAILLGDCEKSVSGLSSGNLYEHIESLDEERALSLMGENKSARLLGFVAEDSSIGRIRFEVKQGAHCADGMLVWCRIDGQKVFYQISAGTTLEEGLDGDKHGYQLAFASQLGLLDEGGFHKYDWLPNMNTPIFTLVDGAVGEEAIAKVDEHFTYGQIPNSKIPVSGDFVNNLNYHTAILGVTGSGKTDLAFDMIRHTVSTGTKVVCIDLTAQYQHRLTDLAPVDLSINSDTALELGEKLFAVETGANKIDANNTNTVTCVDLC